MAIPLVTAIIDTFNHEGYIQQAIDSVLAQGLSAIDLEIIVVDDGSTDGTWQAVNKFASRIRAVRKPNGGQASALNAAICMARGEIIAFLDGDDWWARNKLRAIIRAFDDNPAIGVVGHGIYEIDAINNRSVVVVPDGERRFFLQTAIDGITFRHIMCFLGTSRVAIRRSVLSKIGPIPDSLIVEADEFMSTMAVAVSGAIVLPQPLAFYRLHAGNLYQFRDADAQGLARKLSVLESLSGALQESLPRLGLDSDIISAVVKPIRVEAQRLRLSLIGGTRWATFQIERLNTQLAYSRTTWGYRVFKAVTLLIALLVPPKIFYKLHSFYGRMNLRRWRQFIGEPSSAAPVSYYNGRDDAT